MKKISEFWGQLKSPELIDVINSRLGEIVNTDDTSLVNLSQQR